MPKDTKSSYQRPNDKGDWTPWDKSLGGFWDGGKHWSEVIADDAEEFMDLASQNEKPFFMYLAFNAPHDPRQSPAEYVNKYPLDKIAVPENYYFRGPVEWMIRTYSKFMHLPATYSTLGSFHAEPGGSMSSGTTD